MRNTTVNVMTRGFGSKQFDPFARRERITRMAPRREPGEHDNKGGNENETPEEKAAREAEEAKQNETPEQKAVREAKEQATRSEGIAKWLIAESQHKAEAAAAAGRTVEQQQAHVAQQQAIAAAVSAREVELTDQFSAEIAEYRNDVIDGLIEAALATKGRTPKDYETIIATLDRTGFIGNDGKVNKANVTKWASELAGSSSSRPPRTGGSRVSGSTNRGMGQFLNKD